MQKFVTCLALAFSIALTSRSFAQEQTQAYNHLPAKAFGQNLRKADGKPRHVVIFLFDGMTAQDFVGIYSVLNFASGKDLNFDFVAVKKGIIHDERGRLGIIASKSIDDVKSADIFIVPGGNHFSVIKNRKALRWVKAMYSSSEYTASICTGAVILAAANATAGLHAGTAWIARQSLASFGVQYVATPPPSVDGKYFSAAGASAGVEIGLMLLEQITKSKSLSEIMEFAAEWNPQMMYGSGNPKTAPPYVMENFLEWTKTDPIFHS